LHISHAIVSATGVPFYSTFVPTHKSFTSLVTTRKSYARGAHTSGRDLFPCNLGQREKITRLSREHITSGTDATTLMEDKSAMRESRDCAPVWLNYMACFKEIRKPGDYLTYLSKVQAIREWLLKNDRASSFELLDLSIYFKFAYFALTLPSQILVHHGCIIYEITAHIDANRCTTGRRNYVSVFPLFPRNCTQSTHSGGRKSWQRIADFRVRFY